MFNRNDKLDNLDKHLYTIRAVQTAQMEDLKMLTLTELDFIKACWLAGIPLLEVANHIRNCGAQDKVEPVTQVYNYLEGRLNDQPNFDWRTLQ